MQEYRNKTIGHICLKSNTGSDKLHFNLEKFSISGRGNIYEEII